MNQNQRFAITVHALTLLAASDAPLTSEMIAASVDTNPVVIRRAMADLRARGFVKSKSGAHGGWGLIRDARKIGLCDVYRALGEDEILAVHGHPNKHCKVGKHIKNTLQDIFDDAQAEMIKSLGKHTVADVLNDVVAREKK
jgi:Rrf2 family protein